jgi:hypothetical protein
VTFLLLASSLGGAVPSWAEGPALTSLGDDPITVDGETGSNTAQADLTLFNPTAQAVDATVKFQATTDPAVGISPIKVQSIPAGEAVAVPVEFTGLDKADKARKKVEGQLVTSGGATPIARAVSITPGPQPSLGVTWTILLPLIAVAAALLMSAVIVLRMGKKRREILGNRAPGTKLDFDKSWAANLTVIGAVFGTVLGAVAYPDVPTEISKDSLIRLNLLFAALLVVGPFLFHAIRGKPPRPKYAKDLTGYVWGLVLACAVVFGAVVGELASLGLLNWELVKGGRAGWIGVLVILGLVIAAFVYCVTTVWELATRDWMAAARPPRKPRPPTDGGGGRTGTTTRATKGRGGRKAGSADELLYGTRLQKQAEPDVAVTVVEPEPAEPPPADLHWSIP